MSSMSVSGLVSGLDTSSLISQLMTAERAPQTALKSKVTTTQSAISAYQSVNTKFAALQTLAEKLAKPATWQVPTGASSSTGVTVSTSSTAAAGSVTFDVTALARAQSVVTDAEPAAAADSPSRSFFLTVNGLDADGAPTSTTTEVQSANGDLSSVAAAINGAGLGMNAVALQVSPGQYRLQVTSATMGAANTFTLDGLGTTTTVSQASDATVRLGVDGNGDDILVRSATNQFSNLLPGTSFTVSAVESAVTVSAAIDPKALAGQVQAMVDAANAVQSEIGNQTAYDSSAKKGSALSGDSTVRRLSQSLSSRSVSVVEGYGSPASAGIQLQRGGTLTFDQDTFLAAFAKDPAAAQALVSGVATQLAGVAKEATDRTTGQLTTAIQGRTALVKDLNARIDDWDLRLQTRQATLQRQFTAMETALSRMSSQSSWLASQVASLG